MTAEIEEKSSLVTNPQAPTTHTVLHCRRCRNNIDRIPRGGLVKLLFFWLPLKKYVCYRCHRKSYRWSSSNSSSRSK